MKRLFATVVKKKRKFIIHVDFIHEKKLIPCALSAFIQDLPVKPLMDNFLI